MSILSAESTIDVDGKDVLRFHPTHKRIKDNIPRCVACGQIDEIGYHESKWCPAMGGDLPFATSSLKLVLKADSGFRSEVSARLSLTQWRAINLILSADPRVSLPIIDQEGKKVGDANVELADMLKVEAFVDESGTAWTPPTAWAYRAACAALRKDPTL